MEISVVIPTYNRSSKILATLEGLLQQTVDARRLEIIVVDDGSNDDTREIVHAFLRKNGRFLWQLHAHDTNKGRAAACNSGIESAKFDVVAFIDDDIVPIPEWAEAHLGRHTLLSIPVAIVGRVQYPVAWQQKSNFIRYLNSRYLGNRLESERYAQLGSSVPPNCFSGGNSSVPRELLFQIGLFDPQIGRGQDIEVGMKLANAGVPILYEPKALVDHYADAAWDIDKYFRAFSRYYKESAPLMNELHPEFATRYGHWFVEPINISRDSLSHIFTKTAFRCASRSLLAKTIRRLVELTDHNSRAYIPLLYRYLQLSAALEGVRQRK